jgi:protein TonB
MAPLGAFPGEGSGEPLSLTVRRGVLALVIFFHVGGGWALTQFEPAKLIVGEIASLEVRTVPAEQAAAPEETPPEPEPPPPEIPVAEPPPPVEVPLTDLASVLDPPPPDLPPPAFPIAAKPPEPQPPKPPPPKPVQRQTVPVPVAPQAQAPAVSSVPKVVQSSQLGFLVPPNPLYPAPSRRAGQQGTVMVRVLVDIAGRPSQVSLQTSSGHTALDESALSAVRAAQFRPYAEAGAAQAVWVIVPIRFVLQ